ncbi:MULTISPECIES: hypothetical protein [Alcaligenaceae]|uniref:hypothetical protein n=1 Tax=Alcaligenaceae TaxID=506 RepID=UPI000DE991C9|nr:hypothetical protein [Eoetvoesiella caeni]MCI2810347.1 hypothetical protein [Eoetvoesiella caeni]NYT54716.1 hypothetical protein [Eoetvoesiella caeni]
MTPKLVVRIPVEKLVKLRLDLYSGNHFGFYTPIKPSEVRQEMLRQIKTGERFLGKIFDTRTMHVARVATLAITGWDEPITIDLRACSRAWPMTDGNHRLAAAILRGDMFISAFVLGEAQFTPDNVLCLPKNHRYGGLAGSQRLSPHKRHRSPWSVGH